MIDKEIDNKLCKIFFHPEEEWEERSKKHLPNFKPFRNILKEYKWYLEQRFVEKSRSLKEDIFRIRFGFEEIPKCEVCGNQCYFHGSVYAPYKAHCNSKECYDELNVQHGQATKLVRYGDKGWNNMEKNKQTCLERHGCEYGWQADITKQHIRETKLERYGDENYTNVQKCTETCRERYNTDNVFQTEWCKDKITASLLEHYGVEHALQNSYLNEKMHNTMEERYGYRDAINVPEFREKQTNTTYENWGSYWSLGSKEVREKGEQTCLEKYGYMHHNQSPEARKHLSYINSQPEMIDRKMATAKARGHCGPKSQMEDKVYEYLLTKYNKDDIERWYKSKLYPWCCDFYIKSLDLYIECNFHPSHGTHEFNPNNEEDVKLLEKYKETVDVSRFNANLVNIWAHKDYIKIQTARNNGLKYLCFYSIPQVKDYFNNL